MTTSLLFQLQQAKSPLRKKLMAYFFTNPQAKLYLRDIATKLRVDPANLSRELRRLVSEGLFISQKQGNLKYFSLDPRYPLYRELKSMIFKTVGVQGAIGSLLSKTPGIKGAFIYGSFARNKERAGSDIDLCFIIRKKEFKEAPLLEGLHKLEGDLGREISFTFFTEEEWKAKQRLKDSFVLALLKGKRIELIRAKT
jgi:predicted nucleotidyltransferase